MNLVIKEGNRELMTLPFQRAPLTPGVHVARVECWFEFKRDNIGKITNIGYVKMLMRDQLLVKDHWLHRLVRRVVGE